VEKKPGANLISLPSLTLEQCVEELLSNYSIAGAGRGMKCLAQDAGIAALCSI